MKEIYEMNQLYISILTEELMSLREENKALKEKINSSNCDPLDELKKRICEVKTQTSDAYKKFDSLQRELNTKEKEVVIAGHEYRTLTHTLTKLQRELNDYTIKGGV